MFIQQAHTLYRKKRIYKVDNGQLAIGHSVVLLYFRGEYRMTDRFWFDICNSRYCWFGFCYIYYIYSNGLYRLRAIYFCIYIRKTIYHLELG